MEYNKLIEWLKNDLDGFKKEIKYDIKEIDSKVDQLLKFKWQIISGSVVISAIVGVLIQFILVFYKP